MSTIRDVAKDAGVSIATISRILSDEPSFKTTDETRERVLESVKKLGYNHQKRSRKAPVLSIGCILAMTAGKYSDPYFTGILLALENRLLEHNCAITIVRNFQELSDPKKLDMLFGHELAGLAVMDDLPAELFNPIRAHFKHIVGCDTAYKALDNVSFDQFQASCQAMNHLAQRGCRKIAYVGGMSPQHLGFDKRLLAIRAMSERLGLVYDERNICDCEWDIPTSLQFVQQILGRPSADRPDAIFAGNDTLASAILPLIHEMGLSVPKDVAVIGFNNDPMSAYTFPALTTVSVPNQEIGKSAADLLYARICGDNSMARNIVFPTELIVRASA